MSLSQEQLVKFAGSTRATINRVLKKEEKRGTLKQVRGFFTVLDRGSLARRAAGSPVTGNAKTGGVPRSS